MERRQVRKSAAGSDPAWRVRPSRSRDFAEGERLIFGIEDLRLGKVEHIIGVKIFFEAVNIVVLDKTYKDGVVYDVNFYWHNEQILRLISEYKITKILRHKQ